MVQQNGPMNISPSSDLVINLSHFFE